MSDRLKLSPERDFGFYQRRKHGKWRAVSPPAPALEAPVADSHAHVHMLPDPAWELARCAANGVDFVCMIVDPSEDGARPFDELCAWELQAGEFLHNFAETHKTMSQNRVSTTNEGEMTGGNSSSPGVLQCTALAQDAETGVQRAVELQKPDFVTDFEQKSKQMARIAVGVHPHNAKLYDDALECELVARLADARVVALGEIGLDYHYDLSPRDVQKRVFRRQAELAREMRLPIALHLRGGADPQLDNAHAEAYAILREIGALGERTLLHCCALPPDELRPWVDAGCYIAYGGALTFKNADAAREGARLVPADRLLLETDAPYMAPEPMRGAACTPAHVIFTAAALAELRGAAPGAARAAFLRQLHDNTLRFYAAPSAV